MNLDHTDLVRALVADYCTDMRKAPVFQRAALRMAQAAEAYADNLDVWLPPSAKQAVVAMRVVMELEPARRRYLEVAEDMMLLPYRQAQARRRAQKQEAAHASSN